MIGDGGNDILTGGSGLDILTGGTGADRFDFDTLSDSLVGVNRDVISDFSRAQLDKIDLSTLDANTNIIGDQLFTFIGNAAFFAAGQVRYDIATGIIQGNTDNALTADFEIALTAVPSLMAADFIL